MKIDMPMHCASIGEAVPTEYGFDRTPEPTLLDRIRRQLGL